MGWWHHQAIHPLTRLVSLIAGVVAVFIAPIDWLAVWTLIIVLGYLRYGTRRTSGVIQALIGGILLGVLRIVNQPAGHFQLLPSAIDGLRFSLMILGSVWVFGSGSMTTMLASLEHSLKKFWGRRPIVGYVMLMMLLGLFFLPYMLQDVREIRTDQSMRQYLGGTKKWRPFHFLRPILAQGLLTSDYIAEALWSRGWRPDGLPVTPRMRGVDVLMGLSWVLVIGLEVARWPNWH
ncbi:MAG: hypothetical protein C7B46_15670 [Sulfobacillus benefaciens]|uniref:Energy-coupling factor transporter transmembrane protein EcfT n=1 Tax=Sulfobacillus benefaciens TaxID=453960 RepID=A0A2T2XC88_9FIRM|nr:MAG: hypothetical protein C7B46_15670 [Sulfobacillus benefaciens]